MQDLAAFEPQLLFGRDPAIFEAHEAARAHLRLTIGLHAPVALFGSHPLALVLDLAEPALRRGVAWIELDDLSHALASLLAHATRLAPLAELEELLGAAGRLPALSELLALGLHALDGRDLGAGELELPQGGPDADQGGALEGDATLDSATVPQGQDIRRSGADEQRREQQRPEQARADGS